MYTGNNLGAGGSQFPGQPQHQHYNWLRPTNMEIPNPRTIFFTKTTTHTTYYLSSTPNETTSSEARRLPTRSPRAAGIVLSTPAVEALLPPCSELVPTVRLA